MLVERALGHLGHGAELVHAGRGEEIAAVALFLASDDSSYVNGMELAADGGATAI